MTTGPARVALVVLDAFCNDVVSPGLTPTLWRLATAGGRHPQGGIAELTAATYPNHATFVTGASTVEHGIVANRVLRDGAWVPASTVGPARPTLFDRCRAAGRTSAAVVGDGYLIGVCGAGAADAHWPPGGELPDDLGRNATGYGRDADVIEALASVGTDPDLLLVQLDEVDAVRHVTGARGDDALEQHRRTDAALGDLVELLAPRWDETVLLVVSDHDQEDLTDTAPIDLRVGLAAAGHDVGAGAGTLAVASQGTAAVVIGDVVDAVVDDVLLGIEGVAGVATLAPDVRVVWGPPGQRFGRHAGPLASEHGSPRTATQLAVVAGGHPAVRGLTRQLERRRPPATVWAAWVAELLDLPPAG
ncbi:MAG: alkaline phosphatase family protein [Actinomycetota bacterium]|nr:alkaline phosphatase family protein [Actinomycetota bacterium]